MNSPEPLSADEIGRLRIHVQHARDAERFAVGFRRDEAERLLATLDAAHQRAEEVWANLRAERKRAETAEDAFMRESVRADRERQRADAAEQSLDGAVAYVQTLKDERAPLRAALAQERARGERWRTAAIGLWHQATRYATDHERELERFISDVEAATPVARAEGDA